MTAPTLDVRFPRWRVLSRLPDELWRTECDFRSPSYFQVLIHLLVQEQQGAIQISNFALYAVSSAMVEDLLVLQVAAENAEDRVALQYVQFEVSTYALHVAIQHGESGKAFDWIHNAVSDRVSQETAREFEFHRFAILLTTRIGWIVEQRQMTFLQWFPNFYYYCRSWSALHPVAEQLMPRAIRLFDSGFPIPELVVRGIIFALNWATAYQHRSEPILAALALTYFNSELPMSLRAQIAVAFLTNAARFTDRSPGAWARWVLSYASHELNPADRLQALLVTIDTAQDWDIRRDIVLEAIDTIVEHLRARFPEPTAFVQRLEQSIKCPVPFDHRRVSRINLASGAAIP